MLRLRPFKACDAQAVVSWVGDEFAFRQWCADRFARYPVTAEDLLRHYEGFAYSDAFYPMTAFDEAGPAGHLILRFTDEGKTVLRFGFVIVDAKRRGTGLGRGMLTLAARFGFGLLGAEKITLGVFENNRPAYACYKSVGFRDVTGPEPEYYPILGENWKCLEMALSKIEGNLI